MDLESGQDKLKNYIMNWIQNQYQQSLLMLDEWLRGVICFCSSLKSCPNGHTLVQLGKSHR